MAIKQDFKATVENGGKQNKTKQCSFVMVIVCASVCLFMMIICYGD